MVHFRGFQMRLALRRTSWSLLALGALGCGGAPEEPGLGVAASRLEGTAGYLDRVTLLNIRGWACDPTSPSTAVTVYLFSDGFVPIGSTTANWNREQPVGASCGGNVAHGYKFQTPASLLDGQDHQVYAYFDAAHTHPLTGSPLTFNSHVLYRQEYINDVTFNAGSIYPQAVLDAHPELHDYFIDPNANVPLTGDNLFVDKTLMFFGTDTSFDPLPALNESCVGSKTGLGVPTPYWRFQRGMDPSGNCSGSVNAFQALGTSIGVSIAPKAVWGDVPKLTGMIPSFNVGGSESPSRAPRVFATSIGNRVHVEAFFKHPYNNIVPIGGHTVAEEGITFLYYTLQFRDDAHPTLRNRHIWFTVRIFQDKYAQSSEPWDQLKNTDVANYVDLGADPNQAIGGIDTILRASSPRVTPCAGSASFTTATLTSEQKYCFELSGLQFQRAVRDLNAKKFRDQQGNLVVFSENPTDYVLNHTNVDAEVWRPGTGAMDPQIAFSYRDMLIKQIDSTVQPVNQTSYTRLGALASETLAGSNQWNASDGDPATFWSSNSFTSSSNSRNASFAGYLPGLHTINTVTIAAAQTSGVFEGFPVTYKISVTDPNNTTWIPVGTYSVQPDLSGVATITLPTAYATQGVFILPTKLSTDRNGTYYFRIAELGAALVEPTKLTMGMLTNEALTGWPASNAGDGNLGTSYSSGLFSSSTNDRGVYLLAYHTDAAGPPPVSTVYLNARMSGTTPLAFPPSYDVWVTNSANTAWVYIGNKTAQPDPGGLVAVGLGATYWTHGVQIKPTALGLDDSGGHYFQMAELATGVR